MTPANRYSPRVYADPGSRLQYKPLCVSSYYESCYYQSKMVEDNQDKDVFNCYVRPSDSLQFVDLLVSI